MTIRIVTDSTCDLPREIARQLKVTVIPLIITRGSKELRDGVDISREDFYAQLPGLAQPPTTAAPGPGAFRWTYERLASEGAKEILSIHISGALSATYESARLAASEVTSASVIAFDSRQLSLGTGFEVLAAAEAASEGRTLPEILDLLDGQIQRTHVCAVLDTLEYMRRGGRMNGAITALGNLLQIKPILKMYDGRPSTERTRTRSGALNRLHELVRLNAPYERAAILHSGALQRAREFLMSIEELLPPGEIWIEEINPVLGAHIGPGVLGFAGVSRQSSMEQE